MTKYLSDDSPQLGIDNTYELFSVIIHKGDDVNQATHHVYVKPYHDSTTWYYFSDTNVHEATVSHHIYIINLVVG
jgi:ubiquitin C-terminal hydrolase